MARSKRDLATKSWQIAGLLMRWLVELFCCTRVGFFDQDFVSHLDIILVLVVAPQKHAHAIRVCASGVCERLQDVSDEGKTLHGRHSCDVQPSF